MIKTKRSQMNTYLYALWEIWRKFKLQAADFHWRMYTTKKNPQEAVQTSVADAKSKQEDVRLMIAMDYYKLRRQTMETGKW